MFRKEKECFVCLRVPPSETLRFAHRIWFSNRVIARKIGLRAAAIIEECYSRKPTFFCGKPNRSILAGLFYLLGPLSGSPKTEREISSIVLCAEPTLLSSHKAWLDTFPDLFPGFRIEKEQDYAGVNYRRTYFKGKLLNQPDRSIGRSDFLKIRNVCPECGGWKSSQAKICLLCAFKKRAILPHLIPRFLSEAKAERDKRLNRGKRICL
jgi:hypothetical protein